MTDNSMFCEVFKIKQIILVNSGASCYTKVRIDQHTALLGANNKGKTSMLNALKFFLLPEENLNDCVNKFGFKNPDGYYNREQSFGFYFPDKNSFLVLEAENPHGPFCVVVNAGGKQFSYERTGVPVPYSDIEHLFWDKESGKNGGTGSPIEGISVSAVASGLKSLGGLVIRDIDNIKARFYHHHHNRPDIGRFCLLPLSQGGKPREIDAWKKLIHLAFDIAAKDKRTLPDTIATIIESRKDRVEAELNVNLPSILERYEKLKSIHVRLQTIRNAKPHWDAFDKAFLAVRDGGSFLINLLLDAEQAISSEEATHVDLREKCHAEYSAASATVSGLATRTTEADTKYKEKNGEVRLLDKQFAAIKKESFALSEVLCGYGDKSIDEIIEGIHAESEADKEKLEALKNREVLRQQFEGLTHKVNEEEERARLLKAQINGTKTTVLDLLPVSAASVLHSLNKSAFAGEFDSLGNVDANTITQFTALFDERSGALGFLGRITPTAFCEYDSAKAMSERENALELITQGISQNRNKLNELAEVAKQPLAQIESTIAELEKQIIADGKSIELLCDRTRIEAQYKTAEESLSSAKAELEELGEAHATLVTELTEAKREQEAARIKRDAAKDRGQELSAWEKRINGVIKFRLEFMQSGYTAAARKEVVLTEELITHLEDQAGLMANQFNEVKELVSRLQDAVALEDDSQSHQSALSLPALTHLHETYALLFGRLDLDESTHQNQVVEHNGDTRLQMQTIEHARKLIADFIKEIETHLADIKVSNVDAVAIEYKLHPQFDELLNAAKSVNMTGGDLPADILYDRIGSFSVEFFDSDRRKDGRLNMARLLASVEYKVKLAGRDSFVSESQSTGTAVMINSRLLAFLLKKLLQVDTRVSLPLLVDEISNLDVKNLRAAREIAEADGFCIFGATPDLTTGISKVIGNYVNLDYFTASESYSPYRTTLYTGVNESLSVISGAPAPAPAPAESGA